MATAARPRARKSLGQHWLTDRKYLDRIAAAADVDGVDAIVEVGAGTGLLTERLAERAQRLIAVELDAVLAAGLRERFAGRENVAVVEADVMTALPEELVAAGGGSAAYAVAGNLPYYIGTAIMRRFLESRLKPRSMVVTLQAEVAESVAAAAGHMSYLSVQVQVHAEARLLFYIPPRAFKPAPKVRSAVVRLDTRDGPAAEVDDPAAFLDLARAGFAAPRKQLRNSLAVGLSRSRKPGARSQEPVDVDAVLEEAGIDGTRRPAELSLEEWRAVYRGWRSQEPGARSRLAGNEKWEMGNEGGGR